MNVISLVILSIYLISLYALGLRVIHMWVRGFPTLLTVVGAFITGTGIGVPVTYFLSVLFAKTEEPILFAVTGFITVVCIAYYVLSARKMSKSPPSLSELLLLIFTGIFSFWLMTKTFHGGPNGELFVGSNNVFDFGHSLGIIRSFSWGSNIPFASPFQSGLPFFYHFFFYFWVAIWEYFGVPIIWAVNIPSIVSFTALCIVVYYAVQTIGKQKLVVGWIAVLFTITNSSLTFWSIVGKKDIWHLPAYPFAGPFDGSTISIFMTLNSYVNQRHLAFAAASGLFFYLVAARGLATKSVTIKKAAVLGVAVGLLFLWNMAIFGLTAGLVSFLFVLYRQWKPLIAFLGGSAIISITLMVPIAPYLYQSALFINSSFISSSYGTYRNLPAWNIGAYLWQNLGILPLVAGLGYLVIPRNLRAPFVPLIASFVGLCVAAGVGKRGFDQKALSFVVIGVNLLAAAGVYWIWTRKAVVAKVAATLMVGILTVSGFIDLLPIKNEFAFPLIGKETIPLISWIHTKTSKKDVFVSYADMIDPVVLAGRKNYFGFFGNVGWYDRSLDVQKMYAGDIELAKTRGISYVLVPKWQKSDFPYQIQLDTLPIAYEDARYRVFAVE